MEGGRRTLGAAPRQSVPGAPLVSIVTVVFNGAVHLEQAITSVLGQSYRNVEYIVIDGGSTDGTVDIIRNYEDRIDYWVSEPDAGIYAAMNRGLQLANGELIGLLNADDFYAPGALDRVAEKYMKDGVKGIYYGDNYVLQDDLSLKYRKRASLRYWRGMTICHQAMFVHSDVYRQLEGYREDYRYAGDYDLFLRAVSAGVALVYVQAFLVNYRDTGLTSRHYAASLAEAKRINRACFGRFSSRHWAYLAGYYRTLSLHALEKIVRAACGQRALDSLRSHYLRKVLLRGEDLVG